MLVITDKKKKIVQSFYFKFDENPFKQNVNSIVLMFSE